MLQKIPMVDLCVFVLSHSHIIVITTRHIGMV
jgi:hypothetical protein